MLVLWEYFYPPVFPETHPFPYSTIFQFPITELLDVIQNDSVYPYKIRFTTAAHVTRMLLGFDLPPVDWTQKDLYLAALRKEIPTRTSPLFIQTMKSAGGASFL